MSTVADLLLARRDDQRVGLRFEDQSWTYAEYVMACVLRAGYLAHRLDTRREPHVGVLLDNVPEYCFWLGGAALPGGTVVGLEASTVLAAMAAEGFRRHPSVAAGRILVVATDADSFLARTPPRSFDVVLFDPMFRHGRAQGEREDR